MEEFKVIKMEMSIPVGQLGLYPKEEWLDPKRKTIHYKDAIVLRGHNVRVSVIQRPDYYILLTDIILDEDIPEIDHPFLSVKKIRGKLYQIQRGTNKEFYERLVFTLHTFFTHQTDELLNQSFIFKKESENENK